MFGSRILLLAPHPDDELAGCCAAMARARAQGSLVSVAFLTTGIPARERLWMWERRSHPSLVDRRRKEAQGVAAVTGACIADFGDVASRQLKNDIGAARRMVERLCTDLRADVLWAPAYEGGHPDHDIANFVASTMRDAVPVWEFSAYNFRGGRVRSNEFPRPAGQEIEIRLSGEERQTKRALLDMYASERGNLDYLQVEREVFRALGEYDYSRPPHDGVLFYRRYGWAAFHPRVNEVRPEEVCRAIAAFRG